MSWNYRVLHHKLEDGSDWFVIREVYYDASGQPDGYAYLSGHVDHGASCAGPTFEEMKADFNSMAKAFDLPVLTPADCGNDEPFLTNDC